MDITIEFTGVAKDIVGASQVTLQVEQGITYRQIIHTLGKLFPALIGVFIAPDGTSLLSMNMFNRNDESMILPGMEEGSPEDGDRLILVSVIVGGANGSPAIEPPRE